MPRHISYYRLAFLPRSSFRGPENGILVNNERLEYLGDAVLDAIVAEYLFNRFPDADEGFMTKLRARIVKRKTLDYLAIKMGIPAMIAPDASSGIKSKHIYGNALEALIGAIYIDRGYGKARKFFVRKIMQEHIDLVLLVEKDPDSKSRIIEWAQKKRLDIAFETREEQVSNSGYPIFICNITIDGEERGTGRGESKKEAEQQAARQALSAIQQV